MTSKNTFKAHPPEDKPHYFLIDEPRLRQLRQLGLVPDLLYTYLASKIEQPFNQHKDGTPRTTRLKPKDFQQRWGIKERSYRQCRRRLEDLKLWSVQDVEIELTVKDPEQIADNLVSFPQVDEESGSTVPEADQLIRPRLDSAENGSVDPKSDQSCRVEAEKPLPVSVSEPLKTIKPLKQQNSTVAVEKAVVEPEELEAVFKQLRSLNVKLNQTVKRTAQKWWHNVPRAIAYLEEQIAAGWVTAPEALFVSACKEGRKPEFLSSYRGYNRQQWWDAAGLHFGKEQRNKLLQSVVEHAGEVWVFFTNGQQITLFEAQRMTWEEIAVLGGEL